ncbi:MAG: PIN domain-containing protein [Patulibacter sp.]
MILVDTSAWVEFLRNTGSSVCEQVDGLLAHDFATCDAVRMELLCGVSTPDQVQSLRRLLARAITLPTGPTHYEQAAVLFRACRAHGFTVRKPIDCLIAAVALDAGAAILHADKDFTALAACTPLVIADGSL